MLNMELLSPAGDAEKLRTAYQYGADAAYIGVPGLSLRAGADGALDPAALRAMKAEFPGRRLYGAVNNVMYDADLRALDARIAELAAYPFDALIVSDVGAARLLRRRLGNVELHLSTQANCLNAEAAAVYRDLGFSRIVPGRELSLRQLAELKAAVGDLQIEVFVHGAMCLAYSGRCFLSRWTTDRSANQGDCAHSCRWQYRVLEEAKRPGEYFPVESGADYTAVMSSKDLCMIDHLDALRDAGVDAVKIEGRMKSAYYVALVTRAYRHALDGNGAAYRDDLFSFSHREYSTGFYFDRTVTEEPAGELYRRRHTFLGVVGAQCGSDRFRIEVRNSFTTDEAIEFIGPDVPRIEDRAFELFDVDGTPVQRATHQLPWVLRTAAPIAPGYLIRRADG